MGNNYFFENTYMCTFFLNFFSKEKERKNLSVICICKRLHFQGTHGKLCRKTFSIKLALKYNALIVTLRNLSRTFDNKMANYDNMIIINYGNNLL